MSKDRNQTSRNGDDDETNVISPRLNRSDSSNLPQSASKQTAHSNESQNELSQTPRQQKFVFNSNVFEKVLQSDDDKNDYYKRKIEFELLAENDEYRQESLRQQTYQSYGNESQFNQHHSSAHFNRAYDYKEFEEVNDQNHPNSYQQRRIQENNQNHFDVQVNNSQSNRDFQENYQDRFEPSANNNFVTSRSDEQFQSNCNQNRFETGAEQFHSIQYYGNSSFVDNSGHRIQRQHFNTRALSVLDDNYEVQNQQQKHRSIPTYIHHNSSLQNERSVSQSVHNPNESFSYCNISAEWLMKRIEELESERNDWRKQSRNFEEKLHEANHCVEKYKTEGTAELSDLKKQFDSYKTQMKKDYKTALDDVAHYRNKSIDYKKQRDDLKSDLKEQEKKHKSAIHKLKDQIEKLKKEANKVAADKSTETDFLPIEPSANLTVHKPIQTLSEVNCPFKKIKPEVIDVEEAVSNLPSDTVDSTTNEGRSSTVLRVTREKFDASIQNQEILQVDESQLGITQKETLESFQIEQALKNKPCLDGDKKNRRSGLPQSPNAQATPSTKLRSKRKSSASTSHDQQRSQKDYYAISKRPKF